MLPRELYDALTRQLPPAYLGGVSKDYSTRESALDALARALGTPGRGRRGGASCNILAPLRSQRPAADVPPQGDDAGA
jgi:hypothetical protein